MRRMHVFALLAVLAGAFIPVAGFSAPPESGFLLRHGSVVDSVRGAAYVAKPDGTIEAVDLGAGRMLWTSADAAVPLALDQDVLVAQREEKPRATERFQVVFLEAAGGRKVSEATITLPDGVRALVTDEKASSFRATADREGALFLISWYYEERLLRGIPPQPGEPVVRLFAGSARVDPQTGRVLVADGGPVGDVPGRWRNYGTPPPAPWLTGNVSARAEGGRGGPLTLKRTETANGRPLPDRLLSKHAVTFVPSSDQRHLLVSERVGEGGPDDPEYLWIVFASDTADRATELRRDVSAAPFFVFSDSVIFESRPHGYVRGEVWVNEPLELQAVRLSTGVPKWKAELRDLSYRGPRPPAH